MDDCYLTISRNATAEVKVKGSRFIGESFRVATVDAAETALTAVRKREYKATHHCYAYRIGHEAPLLFKYSDDGEPNGTAGRPLFDLLEGRDVTDTLLIVTRYFGGTKLGTGGLVRAYSETGRATLELSGSKEQLIVRRFRIEIAFAYYDKWVKEMHRLEARVIDSEFGEQVRLVVEVRRSGAKQLAETLVEVTSGRGKLEEIA